MVSDEVIKIVGVRCAGGWMNNFSKHRILFNDRVWYSAEALFQALRFEDTSIQDALARCESPYDAKSISEGFADQRTVSAMSDQDVENMRLVIKLKLAFHPYLVGKLLQTGDHHIIEDCSSSPSESGRFWGQCFVDGAWFGSNVLGSVWMQLRDDLRADSEGSPSLSASTELAGPSVEQGLNSDEPPIGMNLIEIPEVCLVILVGPSGSGKSTFARRNFVSSEIVSLESCRKMICDDAGNSKMDRHAWPLLHQIVKSRLGQGRMTVVDHTNVSRKDRFELRKIARDLHMICVAFVLNVDVETCLERIEKSKGRHANQKRIRKQLSAMPIDEGPYKQEGIGQVNVLNAQTTNALVVRSPFPFDLRDLSGPFDIIGDVHGCGDELGALLGTLGYDVVNSRATHHDKRRVIFCGDLVNRGPKSIEVLRLVMNMVRDGDALCLLGNHDLKLLKHLRRSGNIDQSSHPTVKAVRHEGLDFEREVIEFLASLPPYLVFNWGKLVVAHAGLPEEMHSRWSKEVRNFAVYGSRTSEKDEQGHIKRLDWASEYRGDATVVYGHTREHGGKWRNKTFCTDTGCVFGGQLTALRYPEREVVSVPASGHYAADNVEDGDDDV
jgi:predicted kinase/predicted NAD-dependent protein-ADP-ribosyltransferase YbiA (DUF1768 family)/diadenosine tetraphosphatase ApaH/serine/threonine PP2A family protein phosphatase